MSYIPSLSLMEFVNEFGITSLFKYRLVCVKLLTVEDVNYLIGYCRGDIDMLNRLYEELLKADLINKKLPNMVYRVVNNIGG